MKIYLCNLCDYETTEKEKLKEHNVSCKNKTSRIPDNFCCKMCSYRAIHTKDLRRHEAQMHIQSTLSPVVYGCEKCEYSTQHEDKLKEHIQCYHSQQSRYFYRQKSKKLNMGEHSKERKGCTSNTPLICSFCKFTTRSVDDLRNHKATHTTNNKQRPTFSGPTISNQKNSNFRCDECESTFIHDDQYKLHKEYFHSARKETYQQ